MGFSKQQKLKKQIIKKFIEEVLKGQKPFTENIFVVSFLIETLLDYFKIKRTDWFMAQIAHESAHFTRTEENLYYSERGLRKYFKKYFEEDEFEKFSKKPQKIANRIYANRIGNGNEKSGDGWTYRGVGLIQVTGKSNHEEASKWIKDKTSTDGRLGLLLQSVIASKKIDSAVTYHILTAFWYWITRHIDNCKNFKACTKAINGGYNGLEDRRRLLSKIHKLQKEK